MLGRSIASWVIRVSVGWLMVDIARDPGGKKFTPSTAQWRAFCADARDLGAACCRGAAYGYLGVHTLGTTAGALRKTLRLVKRPPPGPQRAAAAVDTGTLAGRWELDTARSESLEPFLVSVGAPRLIAKMVGSKGKPVTITMGAATVEVTTDGKPPERLSLKGAAEVETPGGAVMATARVQRGGRALVVEKAGPRDGERTVETRTLQDDGALRCEFTHHPSGNAKAVTVVRFYTRA